MTEAANFIDAGYILELTSSESRELASCKLGLRYRFQVLLEHLVELYW